MSRESLSAFLTEEMARMLAERWEEEQRVLDDTTVNITPLRVVGEARGVVRVRFEREDEKS